MYKNILYVIYNTMEVFQNDTHHQNLLMPYHRRIYDADRSLIKRRTEKMVCKTNKHIKEILNNIKNLKNNTCKKYQISGYHEYKLLSHELSQIDGVKYSMIEDKTLTKNVVSMIQGRYSNECCYDCDGIYTYKHMKVPVVYINIIKN